MESKKVSKSEIEALRSLRTQISLVIYLKSESAPNIDTATHLFIASTNIPLMTA